MLEYIQEENVWTTLAMDDKPVVLYGMGLGAEKIMDALALHGVRAAEVFASDGFVRGHTFKGYKVLTYREVCERYDDFNVVLCFATHLPDVIENIRRINEEHTVFAPDVPVAGSGLFTREYITHHELLFDEAYRGLADEESKRVYLDILRYKVSGKIDYLLSSFADKDSIYRDILKLTPHENILDLGAYDGDTIREFLAATGGEYDYITALEPDEKNFKKLLKNTEELFDITCLNMGAWDIKDTLIFDTRAGRNSRLSAKGRSVEVINVDALELSPTFIKMDIEGAEFPALCGLENTIRKYAPKLYICAYHRNEDMFALPHKIWKINPDYKIYFRHSPYIPAWESNFYCVAE